MNYLDKKKRIKKKLSSNEIILIYTYKFYKKSIGRLATYINNEDGN